MLEHLSVKNDDNGKVYNFSFVQVQFQNLLEISLSEFYKAFELLDEVITSFGSNSAHSYSFYFMDPELGPVRVKAPKEKGKRLNFDVCQIDEWTEILPAKKNEVYLVK